MIKKEKLNEIKKSLPRGSLKRIQKKAKVSYPTVLEFFKGNTNNVSVMEAVIAFNKKHRTIIDKINSI